MRKITISGNLGGDAIRRFMPDGSSFLNFSVGVYDGKDKNGNAKTQWYSVTFSGKLADTIEKDLLKGAKVIVNGDLSIGFFMGKDGSPVITANISYPTVEVTSLAVGDGSSRSQSYNNNNVNYATKPSTKTNPDPIDDDFSNISSDDIPF